MATLREKWLAHFLDAGASTFMRKAASARAAGYKCKDENFRKIGWENYKDYEPQIAEWLDENGLSESALKLKLASLLDAKEVKVFQYEGRVIKSEEFNSLGIQLKALEMALKVKGMFAPEKREITNKNDFSDLTDEQLDKELAQLEEWDKKQNGEA
ncbi:hypothetical protein [Maridesulfovibrio bastinii]|uniref:hypothetical protein n=1 Tax=Maridesulfovibrio bastinii TaxID=47157 RepID=UPI000410E5A2|nr:hypothetical protein [Maridesulfovibrio bastinii]